MKSCDKGFLSRSTLGKLSVIMAALLLVSGGTDTLQAKDQCPEEVSKPLLETIHDTHMQETEPVRVRGAILELGERRCVDAIGDLISVLTLRYPYPKPDERVHLQPLFTGTRYPATSALFQIGEPALPALLKVIETNEADSLEAKNARFTVRSIFREEPSDADKFFKHEAAKAPTPEAKRRLLKALETAKEDFHSD